MQEPLTMSKKERNWSHMFAQLHAGTISVEDVATALGISERHVYRCKARYAAEGDAALVHGLRGRPSNHRYPEKAFREVVELYEQQYADYGPTLFTEKLEEKTGKVYAVETIRGWLIGAHLWAGGRACRRHRKKRPRRDAIGSMVQIDGSIHAWFEERGPSCCLFVFIDDASSRLYLRFAPTENIHDALEALKRYVVKFGRFQQAYTDRGSVYITPDHRPTAFTDSVVALGGTMIYARSPQGKGRVERSNRTHQDRLVKALREHNISTIEEANLYLEAEYIDAHNARFAITDGLADVHRPVDGLDLDNLICVRHTRAVNHDMTFQYHATYYQILRQQALVPLPRQRVDIRVWLDGSLHAFWREHELRVLECQTRPETGPHPPVPPAEDHPWRHARPIGKARRKAIKRPTHDDSDYGHD